MLVFQMVRYIRVLLCLLAVATSYAHQAERIHSQTFIRQFGTYIFDDAGSSIEVITAEDKTPSLVFEFRSITKHSNSSTKTSFNETGILRAKEWFVFVESPQRIWIFDGKNSLSVVEQRALGENITTSIKDFDAQSDAICPIQVKDALPREAREALFKKKR